MYWTFFGTLFLIFLTYQDIKTLHVDDRKNLIMLGLSISLISHYERSIIYIIALIIIGNLMKKLLNKFKMADGDNSALNWIFYGYGIINPYYMLFFNIYLIVVTIIYHIIKRIIIKNNEPTPYYPVILITFIFNNYLYNLY